MIDTEKLRSRILSLAMRGELSERSTQDGLASDLYAQIIETKSKLVKSGNIRKDKKYEEIEDDNMPYQIPDNWCWVRFGKIINLQSGQDLKPSEYNDHENGIPYITGASNYGDDGSIKINRWTDYPKAYAYKNDILLSCKGTVGKLTVLQEKEVHIARQIMGIRTYDVDVGFIFYYLQSMIYGIKDAQKGLIPGIERNDVLDLLCPLPPLPEQKRIVKKIEALFCELSQIDRLQDQYSSNQEALKGKLIDAAIQGKLTEQMPEDGIAEDLFQQIQIEKNSLIKGKIIKKAKPLPEINNDEVPFDIPNNWKWVRWGSLSNQIQYGYNAPAQSSGRIKMVRITDIQNNTVKWETVPFCEISEDDIPDYLLHINDILFARSGATVGKSYLVESIEEDAVFAGYLIRTNFSNSLSAKYLKRFMESSLYWRQLTNGTTATAQPNCNAQTLSKMMVPLPPLAEQERIAKIIDDVFEAINRAV